MDGLIGVFTGIILALLVIYLEYEWWAKAVNKKRFHFVGFTSVAIVSLILFYVFNWSLVYLTALTISYWNVFELIGNRAHGQEWLYVGTTANFDKQIRKFKHYRDIKLFLHIQTLNILIFILL